MATQENQKKKKGSIFPDFPRGSPAVDKDGNLTHAWHLQLSALFQGLQRNFKNEGIQLPQLDDNEIATIQGLYNPKYLGQALPQNLPDISGQVIFDKTDRVPKVFIITYNTDNTILDASWKTFTVT